MNNEPSNYLEIINQIFDRISKQCNWDPDRSICIVNLSTIKEQYEQWNKYLSFIHPYYAIKCNPDPVILSFMCSLGMNFDCASKCEIKTVMDIIRNKNKDACVSSRIIYANPCKMFTHLAYAAKNSIDLLTFDCKEELYKIKSYHDKARLLLRIAVDDKNSVCAFNKKFGCKICDITDLLKLSVKMQLNVVGISFHLGSMCTSAKSYYNAIHMCRIAYDIALECDIQFSILDIGGGFPGNNSTYCNFIQIAENIHTGINDFFSEEYKSDKMTFIAEPGRYFVEKSHTIIVKIIGKKKIFNDSNMMFIYYINEGAYGSFNCTIFDHVFPKFIPMKSYEYLSVLYNSRIFGPTCDSMDIIHESILLPELFIGDYLYAENMGAYTLSAGCEFNGIERPAIYYI
jgi:ornithine decarboxylase